MAAAGGREARGGGELTVALISDLFHDGEGMARLAARIEEARARGADLALLPELPLNRWIGASRRMREEDAEEPGGPRHQQLAAAARAAGVAILGGAIVRDGHGRRHNTSLLFDAAGALVHSYRKLHLPDEDGFLETSHYEPGNDAPQVSAALGLPVGVQICSDINRPEGTHLLGALGAEAILCPRATESSTWPRWKTVLQANAITTSAWVLTVNRPLPEEGVPLGGPSAAFAPDGTVALETTTPVAIVTIDRASVTAARRAYPGYMPVRADLYARGWGSVPRIR